MEKAEELFKKLTKSIKGYFDNAKCSDAILGLSGGIDSAVVAALAVKALGKEHVHCILMPSPFSTVHSVTDALKLCELCGINYEIIPIDAIYHRFIKELTFLAHTPFDTTEENIQARIRGTILMAYSNKKGALLLNTSNKSELAMGYGTLYGDLAGAMMVLGDCYKTEVYALADYLNSNPDNPMIPQNIIDKAPSAELHLGQKDSDSLPDYNILDNILFQLIEGKKSKEDIVAMGYEEDIVNMIISKMGKSSFKVMQVPPVIKVSTRPLLPEFKCI